MQGRAAGEPRRDVQGSSTSSLLPSRPAQRPRLKRVGRLPSKTLDGQGEMESNREISRFLLRPASAKSSCGKPPDCRALGLCADSPEVLDCGAWGKGAEGPCEILQGEEDAPPRPAPEGSRSSLGSLHLRVGDQRPPALGCVPTFCSLGGVASTAPGNPAQPGLGVCAWLRKTRPPRVWAREQTRGRELHAKRLFLDTQGLEPEVITPSVC